MHVLPGFWHAAAHLSGRLDLSSLGRADPSGWSAARFAERGLSADTLPDAPPLASPDPFLTLADARYPAALAVVPYAPPVLFYRGDLGLLEAPCVALVGARRCSAPGSQMARALGAAVAAAGGAVVSGMAYGIDAAAHRGAGGRTIAVLGQALDADLSPTQQQLMREIHAKGGLILSEFLPGTTAQRWTFPQRNRVIAWLSRGVVVVEAAARSGSLITARAALEAGREVLAVPGHPLSEHSAGCLALIDDGAPLVRSGPELLERLGLAAPSARPAAPPHPLLAALGAGAGVEALQARTGLPLADLVRQLAALELTGLVQRLPGDRYVPATGAR